MYGDTRGKKPDLGNVIPGPSILRCEVEKALRRMRWRKAEGSDGVIVEMAKVTENFAITKSTDLAIKYIEQVTFRREWRNRNLL